MNKNTLIGIVVVVVLILGFVYFTGDTQKEEQMMTVETGTYSLTITNKSDSQPLSPGAFIVHTGSVSLNYEGNLSPSALEPLAEYGSNAAFKEMLAGIDGVMEVIALDAPILPGESRTVSFEVSKEGLFLSGIQMAVGSNDGYALIDSVMLDGNNIIVNALNYDNGTEENNALGSGFDGGQPDPSRGALNVENGTATNPQENVSRHAQLISTIMEISLEMQK